MTVNIDDDDEQILIDLRYGVADLLALCGKLSGELLQDAIGVTNLLQAIDIQAGLLLHLKVVQATAKRSDTFLVACA